MNGRSTISRIVEKPPCIGRRSATVGQRIRRAQGLDEIGARRQPVAVALVDPVPREVAQGDGRHAGAPAAANASGGMSPTTRRAPSDRSHAASASARSSKRAMKRGRAATVRGLVEAEAVDLDDAGVALERVEVDRPRERQVEQPLRRRRADGDRHVRRHAPERVEHLDVAGGMAEAVAGDVEDDHDGTKDVGRGCEPWTRTPAKPFDAQSASFGRQRWFIGGQCFAQHVFERRGRDKAHVLLEIGRQFLEIGRVARRQDERLDAHAARGQRLFANAARPAAPAPTG